MEGLSDLAAGPTVARDVEPRESPEKRDSGAGSIKVDGGGLGEAFLGTTPCRFRPLEVNIFSPFGNLGQDGDSVRQYLGEATIDEGVEGIAADSVPHFAGL